MDTRFVAVTLIALSGAIPGFAQDPPAQRGVTPPLPPPASATGRFYAMVVGIGRYRQLPPLETAVNDAKAVGSMLHDQYGFEIRLILDSDATRANILDAVNWYRRNLHDDDNLLIYYAGHGRFDRDAGRAYWLPVDASPESSSDWIGADDFTTAAKTLPARHVLVVADSCYSGGMTRGAGVQERPADRNVYLRKMLQARSRNLMASGGNEPVTDAGRSGHSVFANAFLNGLQRMSGSFSAAELYEQFVREPVASGSAQVPQYNFLPDSGHEDGDFVFPARSPAAVPTDGARSARLSQAFQAGVAAIQNRQWDEAIARLTEASAIDPSQKAVWAQLAAAHMGVAASKTGADSSTALQKAIEAYGKAIALSPNEAGLRNNLGIALGKADRLPEMQVQLEQAVKLDPSNASRYYYNLGGAMLNSRHPDAAVAAFRKAIDAAPVVPDAYFQYASILLKDAQLSGGKAILPQEALDAFNKYLQLAPNDPRAALAKQALAFHGSTVVASFEAPLPPGNRGNRAAAAQAVDETVQQGKLLSRASPAYPPLARSFRISGAVSLRALIGEDGAIDSLVVESGHPMLIAAALNAVKTWTYRPTLVNNQPVRVRTQISVLFNLQ